jgi:sporulation protein YlmC with PRC-barrel domain
MKTLLSTTAMLIAIGLPTLTYAQTEAPATAEAQTDAGIAGFLNQRDLADIYVSELIGMDVYARAEPFVAGTDAAMFSRADLDGMETIGQITEVVLSQGGQIRAVVIGIGGFLGMGEQDAAVTMDQVSFVTDAEDPSQMYVVVNTGLEMLRTAPAYDRTAMGTDGMDTAAPMTERTAFAAPQIEREGYDRVEVIDVSTEMLMGKSVYDVNDTDVGTVADMIIDDSGAITEVIIDFGGFLGMGVSHAALKYDEVTVLSTEGYSEVRLYVDATKEQIEALPQYEAIK